MKVTSAVPVLAICAFLMTCCCSSENPPKLSEAEKEEIRTALAKRVVSESLAEDFAKRHGPGAVPFLIEMLQAEDTPVHLKGGVAYGLGKFGDPRALQPIMEFIECPMSEEMTEEQLNAILSAIVGLGFTGADTGLDYLRKLASEDYWLKRPERPRVAKYGPKGVPLNEKETRTKLREHAIQGLSCADTVRAVEILKELKEGPAKDLVGEVNRRLEYAERRLRDGPPWTWTYGDEYGRRYRITP